jgi:hypothetical protein
VGYDMDRGSSLDVSPICWASGQKGSPSRLYVNVGKWQRNSGGAGRMNSPGRVLGTATNGSVDITLLASGGRSAGY